MTKGRKQASGSGVQISTNSVSVKRSLEVTDSGAIVTHRLTVLVDVPVAVCIVEKFPAGLSEADVGFHSKYKPSKGVTTDAGVIYGDVVPADDELVIVYGLRLSDPEDLRSLAPPIVDVSQPVEAETDAADVLDDVFERRGTAAASIEPDDERGDQAADDRPRDRAAAGNATGRSSAADAASEASAESPTDEPAPSPTEDGSSDEEAVGDAPVEAERGTTDENPAQFEFPGEDGSESASASTADETGSTRDARDDADGGVDDDSGDGTSTGSEPAAVEGSIVEALLAELQQDAVSDEQRQALCEALGADQPESMDVRLRYVMARLDEFEAYIDAFEGLVDERGSASAFMEDVNEWLSAIEADVDALRADIENVEERLEAAADARAELLGRIDEVGAALDALDERVTDDVDGLRDDLADVRDTHETDVDALRTEVETCTEEALAAVEEVRADVEGLQDEVVQSRALREALTETLEHLEDVDREREGSD